MENNVTDIIRNFRCKFGEIDIIGKDGEYITFFEVKYRKSNISGEAEYSVGQRKQWVISRVIDFFRYKNNLPEDIPFRIDVLAVNGNSIKWYKNAFDYISQ